MSKIFDVDFRKGTLVDSVSKTVGTITGSNAKFSQHSKGNSFCFTNQATPTQYINYGNLTRVNVGSGSITFVIAFKYKDTGTFQTILSKSTFNDDFEILTSSDDKIQFYVDNVLTQTASGALKSGIDYLAVIQRAAGGATSIYLTSDSTVATNTGVTGNIDNSNNLLVGSRGGAGSTSPAGCLYYIRIYNTILSTLERTNLYQEFIYSYNLSEPKINIGGTFNLPTDLSNENGLVAAYNANPINVQNGTWIDVSQNGKTGTITGALLSNEGVRFKTGNKIDFTDYSIGTVHSFCFRVKPLATGDVILGSGGNYVQLFSNQITYRTNSETAKSLNTSINLTEYSNITITRNGTTVTGYLNGVSIGNVTLDANGAFTATQFGGYGAGFDYEGEIVDFRIYNKTLSLQEAKDYHNSFAKQTSLQETFKYDNADGSNLTPQDWIKGTGSYKIGEITTQDSVLKDLDIGTKYIQCTSAGTIAIPQDEAYGTWEFDVYKGADANVFYFQIIGANKNAPPNSNGYVLQLDGNEGIALYRTTAGFSTLCYSGINYVSNNIWYRIKITRTTAGVFTVYIKGGNFGNSYVTVSVAGGSGTNPVTDATYTTSKYFVLDLDAGDRITLIKKQKGIEV